MVICPVAIAVGCRKCPIFKVCPVKGVIGDYRPEDPAPRATATGVPPHPPRPTNVGRSEARKSARVPTPGARDAVNVSRPGDGREAQGTHRPNGGGAAKGRRKGRRR